MHTLSRISNIGGNVYIEPADRKKVVEALVNTFKKVEDGEGPSLVVLSAPTGYGKTRIVQEFYAHVSAKQKWPYWPARLEGDILRPWTETRKCVFPASFYVPPGAVMDWMWWGVSCSLHQDGTPAHALSEYAPQLAAHSSYCANIGGPGFTLCNISRS